MLDGNAGFDPSATWLISRANLSAVTTTTFSSIPQGYSSLQLRFNLVSSGNDTLNIQPNNDTTAADYTIHYLVGTGAAATAGANTSNGWLAVPAYGRLKATYASVGIVDFLDYANTSKYKTLRSTFGYNNNTTAGTIELDSGVWLSTSAITSLVITTQFGATLTGTIALYGMK
jgi:hypothetical protein